MFGNFEQAIAILGALLGLVGSIATGVTWYRSAIRKEYAAQRDFNHLKNNYDSLSLIASNIIKEQDDRFDRIDISHARLESKLDATLTALGHCSGID